MSGHLHPENHQTLLTNYIKLLRISEIKYVIHSLPQPDDMAIIEAELDLRSTNARLLSVHYNRELWVFSISATEDPPSPDPKFGLHASDVKRFEFKNMARAGNGTPSNIMTLLSVTFLRSLKKLIMVQLAEKGEIIPFANAGLLTSSSNRLLLVSPKLGYSGDVFVNLASRGHQFRKLLDIIDDKDEIIHDKYAVYLAPSGIRVYLANGTIRDSITKEISSSTSETVTKMLRMYHGITIDTSRTEWIDVIPNLSHINGITCVISKYLEPINNTKHLSWPLDLCYIQEATSSSPSLRKSEEYTAEDPLSLIDDFVQLKATATAAYSSVVKTPSSANMNTPMSSQLPSNMATTGNMHYHMYTGNSMTPGSVPANTGGGGLINSPLNMMMRSSPVVNLLNGDLTPSLGLELNHGDSHDIVIPDIPADENNGQNWQDLDAELFGDEDDFDLFGDGADIKEVDAVENDKLLQADLDSELGLLTEDKFPADTTTILPEYVDPKIEQFDIPLNEITIKPSSTISPYDDPGAPKPAITPFPGSTDRPPLTIDRQRKGSIFSPLNFNPIIKSGVDDKYANGGKFFVNMIRSEGGTPNSLGNKSAFVNEYHTEINEDEGAIISDTESEYEEEEEEEQDEMLPEIQSLIPLASTQQSPLFISSNGTELRTLDLSISPTSPSLGPERSDPSIKRQKLDSPPPSEPLGFPSDQTSDIPATSNIATNTSIGSSNVPNVIPFLLRPVTIHSIPLTFHVKKPKISKSQLPELINQISWCNDTLINTFNECSASYNDIYPESINRTIAQLFPDFTTCDLSQFCEVSRDDGTDELDFSLNRLIPITNHNTMIEDEDQILFKPHDAYGAELKPGMDPSEDPINIMNSGNNNHTNTINNNIISNNNNNNNGVNSNTSNIQYEILPEPRIKVRRNNHQGSISLNASALKLWGVLGLEPIDGNKDSHVLMVCPEKIQAEEFLDGLIGAYSQAMLGVLKKCGNGIIEYAEDNLQNVQWEEKFKDIQFVDEILVLFVDYERSINSIISIIEIFEKFKRVLGKLFYKNEIKLNLKIIPGSYISINGVPSMLSMSKLTEICLSLYNNNFHSSNSRESGKLATSLPSKINFQLTSKAVAESLLHEDIFIHLSYERSIDKEWLVASWCDNLCTVRKVSAWNCSSNKGAAGLESTMNEMWQITNELSAQLGTCSKKKYLVLTRLDGVIPDDELSQWKRLSKSRDLSLIIVSVDVFSKLRVRVQNPKFPLNKIFNHLNVHTDKEESSTIPTVESSTDLTPQPIFANSPDIFNSTISIRPIHNNNNNNNNNLDDQLTLLNLASTTHTLILQTPTSLSNSPNRLAIKTGYLLCALPESDNEMSVFEAQLLTCPNTFISAGDLLNVLLGHWGRFKSIGDVVYGVNGGVVPWNVAVVRKCVESLVHYEYCEEKQLDKEIVL